MGKCKVLEKCKTCSCCQKNNTGLSEKLTAHRPTERIIERQIVELATRCQGAECQGGNNANERS